MSNKRVCMKCNSVVEVLGVAPHGIRTYHCHRCGTLLVSDTRPIGKRFGARIGSHAKTKAKNRRRDILAKKSRRRNR